MKVKADRFFEKKASHIDWPFLFLTPHIFLLKIIHMEDVLIKEYQQN